MPDYSRLLRRLAGNNEIEAPELDYEGVESDLLDAVNKLPDENRSIPQQPTTPQQQEQVVADPESSAIDEYKQYLKEGPSSQERWGRVLAAAADTFGGGGGAFTKLRNNMDSEEDRLRKRASLELQEKADEQKYKLLFAKSRNKISDEKVKQEGKDVDALEKYGRISLGLERGATKVGRDWDRVDKINRAQDLMNDIRSGKVTFDEVSNTDYSGLFSGLITGRSPGIEMIKASKYNYLAGDMNQWLSYVTGNPEQAVSEEMMKEMENMIKGLDKNIKHSMSKQQARLFKIYQKRLKRNPEQMELYKDNIKEWVDFDEKGKARERRFDDPFVGKDPSRQKPRSQETEKSSDNLSIFRRLTGRK